MPRPQKDRIINQPPAFSSFKPTGVMRKGLEKIALSLDEYEAIRLADYKQMDHVDASKEMEISRSTFTRLLERARSKAAALFVEGKELVIEGGNIHFRRNRVQCRFCGKICNTEFHEKVSACPECGSEALNDIANGFGHGRCCYTYQNRSKFNGSK
ncbi:MAG: DUF134 domain-containing protein [Spirochaetia bacterium]